MLRSFAALFVLMTLSGCVLALEEAALLDAGAGFGAGEAAGVAARGALASEPIILSDEIGSSFRSVRFSPGIRGQLTESLSRITNDGRGAATMRISTGGAIEGNGYTVARIGPDGIVYTPTGMRLGIITSRGALFEYTRAGQLRAIGYVRGLTQPNAGTIFRSSASHTPLVRIPPSSLLRIVRIESGGYWVSLESGAIGWLPSSNLLALLILALDQRVAACGGGEGAIVTRSNQFVRFKKCAATPQGLYVETDNEIMTVSSASISEVWRGAISVQGDSDVRTSVLGRLRSDGIIYPPPSAYTLLPEGGPRINGKRTSGLRDAPQ